MNIIIKPPQDPEIPSNYVRIFLAGSIEMGKAEDWQTRAEHALLDPELGSIAIFNPRRDDWDSSWAQTIDNPQFVEQVTWELDSLEQADIIMVYFDPATMSPITLMELGLHADKGKLVVCCPEGFWRKGNVDVICKRYNIPLFETFDDTIDCIKSRLWRWAVGQK